MPILQSSRDSQVAGYNFLSEGGAIGTYRLGLFIDSFSLVDFFFVQPKVAFTSAGLATISFGFIINGASFPAGIVLPQPFGGPFPVASPTGFTNSFPLEITMSIAVAPLTGGSCLVFAEYFNADF